MVVTYRNKFNERYGFHPNESHSIKAIARLTGYKKAGLEVIYEKGMAAFYNNRAAVRPSVNNPQQWAMARIYSAVMGGKAARVDAAHLNK
jgi:hypothetical protein